MAASGSGLALMRGLHYRLLGLADGLYVMHVVGAPSSQSKRKTHKPGTGKYLFIHSYSNTCSYIVICFRHSLFIIVIGKCNSKYYE